MLMAVLARPAHNRNPFTYANLLLVHEKALLNVLIYKLVHWISINYIQCGAFVLLLFPPLML